MKLRAMLTQTANEYLTPFLPLMGEVEIFEVGTDGRVIKAVFRVEYLNGKLSAPVEIRHCSFIVGVELPYPRGRKVPALFSIEPGEESKREWTLEERQRNRHAQQYPGPIKPVLRVSGAERSAPSRSACPYCMTSLEEYCPYGHMSAG